MSLCTEFASREAAAMIIPAELKYEYKYKYKYKYKYARIVTPFFVHSNLCPMSALYRLVPTITLLFQFLLHSAAVFA